MAEIYNPHQTKINYSSWRLILDLFALLKPYKLKFFASTFLRLTGDIAGLYPTYALAFIVTFFTSYAKGQSLTPIWIVISVYVLSSLYRVISLFFAKNWGFQVSEKVGLDSVQKAIRHLFLLDIAWHEKENAGNKLKRINNGSEGFNRILRAWIGVFIETGVNFFGAVFIISKFDMTVTLIVIAFIITYLLISSPLIKKAGEAAWKVNAQEEKLNGLSFESLNNIRSVKVMSMTSAILRITEENIRELFRRVKIRILRFQLRSSILDFWGYVFRIGVIILIIAGITQGRYEIGFLILFNGYFNHIWQSVKEVSDLSEQFVTAKYSISRMKTILDEPAGIDDENTKQVFDPNWEKIEVSGLSFSYGKNKVIDDVSFEVKRGEKIGIVGLSGAGKSTLFKLLLKEHENYSGEIAFDGLSLKSISKKDYFNYISVVLQDTEVFNFSLRENVTIVNEKEEGNEELFGKAMRVSHVYDFLNKLPAGPSTLIGEKGVKLSGGEKQRLGIARAIFKEPQILLLDEATSHLDLESEEKIRDSLHQFFENVTAIVIAHRLTTIKEMNRILVMEDGKIVESGSFSELQKKRGRFFELWEKQKL